MLEPNLVPRSLLPADINPPSPDGRTALTGFWRACLDALNDIATSLKRMADVHAPPLDPHVNTTYVAKRLGRTPTRIAQMARNGGIPKKCIVPGTGNGTPWTFFRDEIDRWLEEGRWHAA